MINWDYIKKIIILCLIIFQEISIFITSKCLRIWWQLFFKVFFVQKHIKILLFLISTNQNHLKNFKININLKLKNKKN